MVHQGSIRLFVLVSLVPLFCFASEADFRKVKHQSVWEELISELQKHEKISLEVPHTPSDIAAMQARTVTKILSWLQEVREVVVSLFQEGTLQFQNVNQSLVTLIEKMNARDESWKQLFITGNEINEKIQEMVKFDSQLIQLITVLTMQIDQLQQQVSNMSNGINAQIQNLQESIDIVSAKVDTAQASVGLLQDQSMSDQELTSVQDIDEAQLTAIQWLKTIYRQLRDHDFVS